MSSREVLLKLKKFWERFWFIVWKDNSPKGWIISILFLFVVIKFIFFPLLSLATGTALPLAIVESCSMYHKGNLLGDFNEWWDRNDDKYNEFNVNQNDFEDFAFKKGLNKGDILFVTGVNPNKIKVGDVIIFEANTANPLIHRVISIRTENNQRFFSTIGDNNNGQLLAERNINERQILGRATLKIAPYLGWLKLIFFESLRLEQERGFCYEN